MRFSSLSPFVACLLPLIGIACGRGLNRGSKQDTARRAQDGEYSVTVGKSARVTSSRRGDTELSVSISCQDLEDTRPHLCKKLKDFGISDCYKLPNAQRKRALRHCKKYCLCKGTEGNANQRTRTVTVDMRAVSPRVQPAKQGENVRDGNQQGQTETTQADEKRSQTLNMQDERRRTYAEVARAREQRTSTGDNSSRRNLPRPRLESRGRHSGGFDNPKRGVYYIWTRKVIL